MSILGMLSTTKEVEDTDGKETRDMTKSKVLKKHLEY